MNRFDQAAKDWDAKPTSILIAKETSTQIAQHINLTNKDILDYGCGTGLLAFSLSDDVKSMTGMDNSQGMVDVFNEKAKKFGFSNTKAVKHNVDIEDLPQKRYDVIVTSMALHHIMHPHTFFQKCKEALKPNGYLCISDLDEEDGTFHAKHNNDGVHHFGFSHQQIKTFYEESGYTLQFLDNICELERENGTFPIFLSIGQI